ncbi:hypothetical protein C5167_037293 [Papaver somniferum]|uniref:Major facilitator superfamily (MFS) profile domain-containing protein n=1 Tax=Papaver somniferum TaxID=3469 RepID=A0A4Y7I6B3_PAPSO|nr:probable sphingolipid transporter spinster homolog 2 isoform X1 [Papaver somniferum]RZC44344.1 hypothetical protein C5167_037293 [Papaver somniferum]
MGEEAAKPSEAEESGNTSSVVVVVPQESESAMRTIPVEGSSSTKSSPWCTPIRLLVIFCVINMLNYIDRGVIASNGVNGDRKKCDKNGVCTAGTGIQGAFDLNNFEDGVLSSAFMVGLLVASPIFASLAKSHNPFRLIGVGLAVWTFATAGCGGSFNYWSIAVCRMLVGVGEASFISLAAPFIDDSAPAAQKTAWLALFYMCIPTGIAIGYVYGGLVGNHLGWRYAFFGEAILMLPFAVLGFVMKPLQLKGFNEAGKAVTSAKTIDPVSGVKGTEVPEGKGDVPAGHGQFSGKISNKTSWSKRALRQISRFGKDMKVLLKDKVYLVNVLGYVAYTFVIGAYSYWGPKAGYSIYQMTNADMTFGGITIICGIVGTLAGGFFLDRISSTINNAFKLLSGATILGGALCFGSFCFKSMYGFIAFFACGQLFLFAAQAPVNFVCLHCVKPSLRPISMAMSTVAIHIFGDVPSSPLVGLLQDRLNNWRNTALILTSIFSVAAGIWFIGVFLHSVDRFDEEENEEDNADTGKSSTTKTSVEENPKRVEPSEP